MIISPSVIFASGVAGTGKSTICKALASNIENAFYIDRDDINQANLNVAQTQSKKIPPFEEYVQNDEIKLETVDTPFGKMLKSGPGSDFYRRHIRDQSYLVQAQIAKTNLELGKVPILDCIVMRQIQDGTLKKFLDYSAFSGYQKYHLHFVADENDLFERIVNRAQLDPYASSRIEVQKTASRDIFHKFVTEEQPMMPDELEQYEHLRINTSQSLISECVVRCFNYFNDLKQ